MKFAVILLIAIVSVGCLQLDQEIEIHANGGGTFIIKGALPLAVARAAIGKETINAENTQSLTRFLDPQLGRKVFTAVPGCEITRYQIYEKNDQFIIQIEGNFTDLQVMVAFKVLGDFELIEREGKRQSLILRLDPIMTDDSAAASVMIAPLSPEEWKQYLNLLKGLKLSLSIKVPHKVLTTSAHLTEGRKARWIYDLSKGNDFLRFRPIIFLDYE